MALGVLMWRPADFWSAAPAEFHAAFGGWLEQKGLKAQAPMSRARLEELLKSHGAPGPSLKLGSRPEP